MSPKSGASQEILVLMISILTPVPIAQHYGTFFTALEHPTSPLSLASLLLGDGLLFFIGSHVVPVRQ